MKKQKTKAVRKIVSLLLIAVMLFTLPGIPVLAKTTEETDNEAESVERTGETREMPSNPVHHCTQKNDGSDYTEWSYVYFGSYPQSEVTGDDLTEEIIGASYDANGDAWVNGVKYRRISQKNINNTQHFGYVAYRYFRWERIKWRVLKNNGDTLFVIADQGLDCKDYHEERMSITWENASLRNWLNNDFYVTAFSIKEQQAILEQIVLNEDCIFSHGTTEGGNDTNDKIFLLSTSDMTNLEYGFCGDQMYTFSESRMMQTSDYAYVMGADDAEKNEDYSGNCSWWLRSPGDLSKTAAYVPYYGTVQPLGCYVDYFDLAVVPALHINLSSDLWSVVDDATNINLDKTEVEMGVGETIILTALLTPSGISSDSIMWFSSNNDVASVSGGKVTAKSIGNAVITAMTPNGLEATCTVKVNKSVIQGQINHQLSGYGGGSSGTSREEEVRCAFQSFASAIDAYMNVLNEAVITEASTKEEVASLREKDQKKSQPVLTGFCDDDGALNAAYAGLAEFYNEFCDDCPGLKKIDLSKSITEIEAQIVNEIAKSYKTYKFSISSGDFNVEVNAYSQWKAFSGSITVTRKKRVSEKPNSYTFMLSSDLDTNKNTMAQYYKVLSDTAEQVVKDGLKAYLKDVAKLAYITQIAQDEFESCISGIVDYMRSKGYGNLLKYAVSLYDGYNIAKRISSLTNKKSLTEALTDAESLYNQIKDLDFSDGSVKNKTVAAALKLVKEKKENLEDILYNYIYHPEKDLNANVNWFEKVWNSWFNGGKKATVQCPVTLTVFDEKGNQIGYAEDGYCEFDDSIYMEVSDDVKTVYIPQSLNVSINFIGTDDGTMNYTLEEFENGLPTGRMNYYDVSLTNGGEYTQTIPSGAMQTSIEALPLNANDGTQVNADEYISVEDSAVCEIDCEVNSGGTVYGIGDYARGDAVTLVAFQIGRAHV